LRSEFLHILANGQIGQKYFTKKTPGKVPAQGQEFIISNNSGRHIEEKEFSHILANVKMAKINYTNEKPK
jgi:hypothetical protein